jgi:hypothetical protein
MLGCGGGLQIFWSCAKYISPHDIMQLGFCVNTGARRIEKASLEVCNPDSGNVAGSARTKHSVTISAVTAKIARGLKISLPELFRRI